MLLFCNCFFFYFEYIFLFLLVIKLINCDKVLFGYLVCENMMYVCYVGLIFDMDGIFLDIEFMYCKVWCEVLGCYGFCFDEQVMVVFNGLLIWFIVQLIIEFNYVDFDFLLLVCEKIDVVKSILLDCVELLLLVEVVKVWYGWCFMLVGIGSESVIVEVLLVYLGLCCYFDVVVVVDYVQYYKFVFDIFLLCVQWMGVMLMQCVVFEDVDFGLQVVWVVGMDVVDV